MNGKEFGLALNQRNPFDLEAIGKSLRIPPITRIPRCGVQLSEAKEPALSPASLKIETAPVSKTIHSEPGITRASTDDHTLATPPAPALRTENQSAPTAEDSERLQLQFQAQLDTLASVGKAAIGTSSITLRHLLASIKTNLFCNLRCETSYNSRQIPVRSTNEPHRASIFF